MTLAKKQNNKKKKDLKRKENQEQFASAISSLEMISRSNNIQRDARNMVKEVLNVLRDEKGGGGSIYFRAANAVSKLDGVTRSHHVQSHIRTMLWQVVTTLESIRE
jgi:uncharacterized protein (UPF0147 family)